jgi:DNA-directed RNA polymerase specialized sigma24 family protein
MRILFAPRGNTVQTRMDLVKGARRGREAAFQQLFDEHRLPLFRFAYRLTGSLADAVMHLPETQREVLILAHYEQMPRAEIAHGILS